MVATHDGAASLISFRSLRATASRTTVRPPDVEEELLVSRMVLPVQEVLELVAVHAHQLRPGHEPELISNRALRHRRHTNHKRAPSRISPHF